VATGRLDDAADAFEAAARRSLAGGDVTHAAHAFHDLVRIGRPERAAEPLAELRQRSDGAVLALFADHARAALPEGTADGLAAVAERFAEVGCDLHAAEAWSRAAERADATGHPRRAAAARRQASMLAADCEGARTPLLATAPAQAFDLSAREREIAELVASGMPRRQIAARLVVSPRTVDSHVQRIYRKLGVRDRAALAAALRTPHPPVPGGG
jgi:DNA-binding CsgD family transcriptional regulator